MYHFGSCIGLLAIVGHSDRVKLPDTIISLEDTRRVFPCHSWASLDLCPGDFGAFMTNPTLGHKIKNPAFAFCVSRKPVLHRGVFDFGMVMGYEFNYGCMQLILVASGCGTSFQITHIAPFIGNDERTFKLPCSRLINTKIGGEFHGAAHPFRDIAKRPVRKDRRV